MLEIIAEYTSPSHPPQMALREKLPCCQKYNRKLYYARRKQCSVVKSQQVNILACFWEKWIFGCLCQIGKDHPLFSAKGAKAYDWEND